MVEMSTVRAMPYIFSNIYLRHVSLRPYAETLAIHSNLNVGACHGFSPSVYYIKISSKIPRAFLILSSTRGLLVLTIPMDPAAFEKLLQYITHQRHYVDVGSLSSLRMMLTIVLF